MGTVSADVIIKRASAELKDPAMKRWSLEQMTAWLGDAQREVCILKPESYVRTVNFECVAGTRQSLPIDGRFLIDVTCNLGLTLTRGDAIRIIERENLDAMAPSWQASTGSSVINSYIYNRQVPKVFFLHPGPQAGVYVEIQYAANPPDPQVESIDDAVASETLVIDDTYLTAVNDYLLMRALGKDTDARDQVRSSEAYQRFLNRLGLGLQAERAHDPNRNSPPRDAKREGGSGANQPF
jgi:hypothetical protein